MELILITSVLSLLNILLVQQVTGDVNSVRPASVDRALQQPAVDGAQSLQEALWGERNIENGQAASVRYE
jgi:hypothetical protein